jgi:hypothetical protein
MSMTAPPLWKNFAMRGAITLLVKDSELQLSCEIIKSTTGNPFTPQITVGINCFVWICCLFLAGTSSPETILSQSDDTQSWTNSHHQSERCGIWSPQSSLAMVATPGLPEFLWLGVAPSTGRASIANGQVPDQANLINDLKLLRAERSGSHQVRRRNGKVVSRGTTEF